MDNLRDEVVRVTTAGIQRVIMPLGLAIIQCKVHTLKYPVIFFDNPSSTQIAQPALYRMIS